MTTVSGNVASMREPLDGSLWWYWIAENAAKKNGASLKNYHRLRQINRLLKKKHLAVQRLNYVYNIQVIGKMDLKNYNNKNVQI